MYTIIETEIFKRYAESIWRYDERQEFITWLAANPLAADRLHQGEVRQLADSLPESIERGNQ